MSKTCAQLTETEYIRLYKPSSNKTACRSPILCIVFEKTLINFFKLFCTFPYKTSTLSKIT